MRLVLYIMIKKKMSGSKGNIFIWHLFVGLFSVKDTATALIIYWSLFGYFLVNYDLFKSTFRYSLIIYRNVLLADDLRTLIKAFRWIICTTNICINNYFKATFDIFSNIRIYLCNANFIQYYYRDHDLIKAMKILAQSQNLSNYIAFMSTESIN